MDTISVCSGGLDSVTLAYQLADENRLASILSFNYGQRHVKELDYAAIAAKRLGVRFDLIDLSALRRVFNNSALTGPVAVPDGRYNEDNIRLTFVPNRNTIMLSIAFGIAAARGINQVGTALHNGDHFVYPDCRPDFIQAFQTMQDYALADYADITLYTPFLNGDKSTIIEIGAQLKVPFIETWSCYKGEAEHCGRCGTCVERQKAFEVADITDPTPYQDTTFWKSSIAQTM